MIAFQNESYWGRGLQDHGAMTASRDGRALGRDRTVHHIKTQHDGALKGIAGRGSLIFKT